ncbi:MAG: SUMF1/EgtB/PvdO family nonheme iron enzyme [Rikenellaceae bacterium]
MKITKIISVFLTALIAISCEQQIEQKLVVIDACLVEYNSNGGTGEMADQFVSEGEIAWLSPNKFTFDGYTFIGWSMEAQGEVEYVDKAEYTAISDMTLYAQWEAMIIEPKMVFVEGGEFMMGLDNTTSGSSGGTFGDESPRHKVYISSFYMGNYEVTQREWVAVMGAYPFAFKGDNLPADKVSWYDAIEYCNARSEVEGLTSYYTIDKSTSDPTNLDNADTYRWTVTPNPQNDGYRLPTEAEWEYAAQGGNISKGYLYSGSDNIDDVAWYVNNANDVSHTVGSKLPNELGLYDMSGNMFEWCWDWYGDYEDTEQSNPTGAEQGTFRCTRGGSWYFVESFCTITNRDRENIYDKYDNLSFRVVRSAK